MCPSGIGICTVQTERPLWQSGLRVEPVVGRGAARHGRGAEREISICCVASIFLDSTAQLRLSCQVQLVVPAFRD